LSTRRSSDLVICRSLITDKYNKSIIVLSYILELLYDISYLFIQIGYHGRICSSWISGRCIRIVPNIRLLIPELFMIVVDPSLWSLQRHVRNIGSIIKKEWGILM